MGVGTQHAQEVTTLPIGDAYETLCSFPGCSVEQMFDTGIAKMSSLIIIIIVGFIY
jgi:hypothetical protein